MDVGISLDIVPFVLKGEKFDYTKFYADVLMLTEVELTYMPDPAETYEELEKT